ncbi:hypothetical protein KXD40_002836 [Peronospora effusa]|uniref:YbeY/UPF0054 family metalloprotein n=1 Tax=Peronospora effusa TaxID=542832 RepID=A0A3M6VPN8_9STRA|nr:hypothetical protein DD238_003928 [Peronospora effusa]RQM09455.1 hypothetical protein DD237_003573 [Peronospora effusa]UIZ29941.1 hypothetical protein KXD40_002836 [Peronospora effusa]
MVLVAKALAGTSAALSRRALVKLQAQTQAMVRCLNCPGGPCIESLYVHSPTWCPLSLTIHRDMGVMLTTNGHMQKLNRKFRKMDKPTDILSFPFHKIRAPGRFPRVKRKEERYLGDIYISPAYIQAQCEDPQLDDVTTLEERLPVLMAHGLCHLMGYDHEQDADYEHMQQAENFILNRYAQFLPPAFATDNTSIPATDTDLM